MNRAIIIFAAFTASLLFTAPARPGSPLKNDDFVVGAWVPYWKKTEGAEAVKAHPDIFNQLSPFSFEVDGGGSIKDTLKIADPPWAELARIAAEKNILVLPTILWTDPQAMHEVLGDPLKRKAHIGGIMKLMKENGLKGIDIDYEGKEVGDKQAFTMFIKELSGAFKKNDYYLSCTVEARTSDYPPASLTGAKRMAWANDLQALNKYCDSVRVMAYDQIFQVGGKKEWSEEIFRRPMPYAPNAETRWVGEVIRYFISKIDKDKLVLGIPTYGWEFEIEQDSSARHYKKIRSLVYPDAAALFKETGASAVRNKTGELILLYEKQGHRYFVCFSDAGSIAQKIALAKAYGISGIFFFKLDGSWEEETWKALESTLPTYAVNR